MQQRFAGLALALGWLMGCDAQATPGYLGEALLALSGSIEIDSQRDRGPLAPALAFYHGETGEFHIMDVDYEGQFPSDFSLRVYRPPPSEAIVRSPDHPAFALGYLTAVTADHPAVIASAHAGTSTGQCGPSSDEENVLCEHESQWCTPDGQTCYRERRRCPNFDSAPDECEILEQSGDPALRQDPFSHFAGLSETHVVIYLPEPLAPNAPWVVEGELPALTVGYHLFEAPGDRERQAVEACEQQAAVLGVEAFNAERGTRLEPEAFLGGVACPPDADPAVDHAPQDAHAQGGADGPDAQEPPTDMEPRMDSEVCDLSQDEWEAAYQLIRDKEQELNCEARGLPRLIPNPEAEPVSVRIGPDVRPSW